MRRDLLAVALVAAAAHLGAAASCNADNCLRALRATQTPGRLASAQSFCATFTATPSLPPAAIPTYASGPCQPNQNGDLYARLSSACSCIAAPSTATSSPTPTEACALVSSSWAAQKAAATATPTVAASLAYDCLNSVPLGKQAALDLVDAIEPYLEWQSDAAYKAHPPPDYFYPPYDMFANLAQVRANLLADRYANEYAFQLDLYVSVFGNGHDGHFVFYPDALTKVFEWIRQRSLVSVSEDGGRSLPVIKLYEDVVAAADADDAARAPVVERINGVPAARYVEDTINKATYNQDPDAAYNSMFFEKANLAAAGTKGYFSSGGRIRYIYQGPNTTFAFANGTVLTLENKATIKADLTGVVDGPSFYAKFCSGGDADLQAAAAAPAPVSAPGTPVPGYPPPVIATNDSVVSGYFLEGEGYEDVAVIALLAFENELPAEFQAVCADFFAAAVAAGKTKLVVDFQANGGGYILQGYDFFRQLFPRIVQDGYSRWKANDGFLAIADLVSDGLAGFDPYTSGDAERVAWYETWFNYRYDLNRTDDNFLTFADKFAPHVFQDTRYTALMRWNLSDPLTTVNATFGMGMEIAGYGTLADLPQPFAAEDIVLLYDGVCASTCTLAAEMLRINAGVKSVAMGGRPRPGRIQGVGGIKGAQVLQFSDIYTYAQAARADFPAGNRTPALARYSDLPIRRSSAAAINARDQILRGNVRDGLPAQFVVEEADCRLYWTPPMIRDVAEIWKAAADAAFHGAPCAAGGIPPPPRKPRGVRPSAAGGAKPPGKRRSENLDKRAFAVQAESATWRAMHEQKAIP